MGICRSSYRFPRGCCCHWRCLRPIRSPAKQTDLMTKKSRTRAHWSPRWHRRRLRLRQSSLLTEATKFRGLHFDPLDCACDDAFGMAEARAPSIECGPQLRCSLSPAVAAWQQTIASRHLTLPMSAATVGSNYFRVAQTASLQPLAIRPGCIESADSTRASRRIPMNERETRAVWQPLKCSRWPCSC